MSDLLRKVDEELVDGVDEVMSSLHVDRDQVTHTRDRLLALAVHSSPVQQFGISFGVGWFTGYLFRRVSRTAAFLLGCSFIGLQGASALGLIRINWRRLGVAVQDRLSRVPSFSGDSESSISAKLFALCQRHIYITSGFTTGAVMALTF